MSLKGMGNVGTASSSNGELCASTPLFQKVSQVPVSSLHAWETHLSSLQVSAAATTADAVKKMLKAMCILPMQVLLAK